jgi:nucleoside-diphosphate-sugar epimerase
LADESKSVIITGAASGMGRAAAERLAKAGWQVLAVDLNADQLKWADSAGIASLVADVSSEVDNARIAAEADRLFGGLNAAIFNAGIVGGGTIDDMTTDFLRRVIDVNLIGPILGIRACLPLLRKRDKPAIVVTASTMGLGGDSENWAYGAAKHGVVGLVRRHPHQCPMSGADQDRHDRYDRGRRACAIRASRRASPAPALGRTGRNGLGDGVPDFACRFLCQWSCPCRRWRGHLGDRDIGSVIGQTECGI